MVVVLTSDRQTFDIDETVWSECATLKNLMEDICDADDVLPLPNVASKELVTTIDFFVTRALKTPQERPSWEEEFMGNFQIDDIFPLILAANYLAAEPLLNASALSVAHRIKGKSPQELRAFLKIENDFTPEEEEQNAKECAWAFV